MADSFGDESSGSALGLGVTGQGSGATLLPPLANSLPLGHSAASGAHPSSNSTSPPLAAAAQSGLTALVGPMSAVTATPVGFGSTFTPGSSPPVVAVSPTVHASSPLTGVGLGVAGVAGAGLLSQIHATSWDPTLSTDWDNEKASQQCILRIKRDIMSIYKEPPPGMFVVPDPQDMTKIHALITGPFDTPYEGGFFLFLFRCPPDYPIHPPRVKLITTGHNTCLETCLTFLFYNIMTWTGPAWSPAQSISSVLISIQSLMTENPYHNEPGFEQVCVQRNSIYVHQVICIPLTTTANTTFFKVEWTTFLDLWSFYSFFHLLFTQDPFGEKRGRFDYQGLLARLSATHRRIREKNVAEDDHNDDDSDSDTSSTGTDPDSQGSSQP
uniref:Ubiquitin-conjugating enzyme E2 Z n=1 Tax=Sphaeramia orbicularis TaxID=375764 RepID=A0A672YVU4_9TELE